MAQAYTPGLAVLERTKIAKTRELPLPGQVLVKIGERVNADTPVLSADRPGELFVVKIADLIGLEPTDVLSGMKVEVGDRIERGRLLCETKTFFGLFTARALSPIAGVVEFFTEINAHLGVRLAPVPISLTAYISGTVTEIVPGRAVTIETNGSLINGIFGVGGERHGTLLPLAVDEDRVIEKSDLQALDLKKKIVVGGKSFASAALDELARQGASAVVTGSIDAPTLRHFVGRDIGFSITGDEDVPFSLIVTEGFGSIPISKQICGLVRKLSGKRASVNGATQVRAGAMRPEIIVPGESEDRAAGASEPHEALMLDVGSTIRLIRVPYFGRFATITELPSEPVKIDTGAVVRVLRAKLETGELVTVPRANVERV